MSIFDLNNGGFNPMGPLTPGYNPNAPHPLAKLMGLPDPNQMNIGAIIAGLTGQMANQAAAPNMGQQQPQGNRFLNMLRDPGLRRSLMMLALAPSGRQNTQSFMQQTALQDQMRRQQAADQQNAQNQRFKQTTELYDIQQKQEGAKQAGMANAVNFANATGMSVQEAADLLGIKYDPEKIGKLDAALSKKRQGEIVYINPATREVSTEAGEGFIQTTKKDAPALLKAINKPETAPTFYKNMKGELRIAAPIDRQLKSWGVTAQQVGLVPIGGDQASKEISEQNKTKELVPGRDIPYPPDVEAQRKRMGAKQEGQVSPGEETPIDANSQSILAQTGLSYPAFMVLTGQSSSLPRDKVSRARAMFEAQQWANKRNVDVSTLGSQYKTYNQVLSSNINRLNSTKIMENELQGTIQNLQGVVNDKDLSKLRAQNVVDIWWGKEVNDDLAQQYAMHLSQLRNELTAYFAATQGRTGNNILEADRRDAENVIKNGIAKGSLQGMATAVANSTKKMGTVMQNSVDTARKGIWDLFGVGANYKSSGPKKKFSKSAWFAANPTGNVDAAVKEAQRQGYEVMD